MIPGEAQEDNYILPPDLGGLRSNYPIVTHDQQYALFHEVMTDWVSPGAQTWPAAYGWPSFNGDVWTIQLTARPGYYVSPENLVAYGLASDDTPPFG